MKKFTAILLTVIMVASLFISCNNSIAPNVTDETVSVSFTEATSRSLTASLDQFKAEKYYWAYKATKKDNTGLISGQTNFAWVKGNDKGLSGVTIPGFSQGLWEFTLYAYTKYEANESNLAYSGVTQAVLQKNSSNVIKVTVNPNPRGDGILIIDVSNIEINAQKSDSNFGQDKFTKYVTVTSLKDGSNKPVPSNYILELPAGAYKVSVDIMESGKDIVYASGSVVATVYANMETKVSGSLDEYIVPAEFNPAINPDVMNKVVYSTPIDSTSSGDVVINKKSESETDNKVKATIPSRAAQSELTKAINENKDSAGATTGNTSIAFSLTVDTTNATENTLNLEIGMNAVITVQESETSSKQISKEISSLDNYVTVEINLQTALQDVVVTHDGSGMQKLNTLNDAITNENGAYYYDADSGLLTIKTKRFSPYAIIYKVPEEAYVAEMNGVKYTSVQAAINAAPDNAGDSVSTISILNNVTEGQAFGFYDSQKNAGKNILIDLNGNTYTFKSPAMGSAGYESQAMHLASGNTLTVKNGTLNIAEDNDNMCMVIQNYCNLTLEDVVVDGTNLSNAYYGSSRVWGANYTASFNSPSAVVIKGNTQIIARPNIQGAGFENVAFDVDIKSNGSVTVDFDGSFTGKVEGNIEYLKSTDDYDNDHINIRGNGVINSKLVTGEGVTPNIQVYGGSFSSDPSAYLANGCVVKLDGGKYVVSLIIGANTELNTGIPAGEDVIDNQAELESRLSSAEENVTNTLYIGEGTFNIDNVDCRNKTIEFVGSGYDKTILKYGTQPFSNGGEQGSCYSFEGANVTFKDVTLQDKNGDDLNYKGFVRSKGLTFENCVLKSRMTYLGENGTVSFKNCTFNTPKYAAWIYSSQTYNFVNCLFESPTGRFLNIYSEKNINPVINATNCMFKDTSDGKDSNAVFNIKSSAETTLRIEDCLVTGASPMYKVANDNTTVIVDGITVYGTAN